MKLRDVSRWLEDVTHPKHPYYHPTQVLMFATISYLSTACLTSIRPLRAMTFAVVAYTISQLIAPFFSQLVEPYRQVSLVPLIGQIALIATTVLLSKIICHLVGQSLSFKEIRKIGVVFLISLFVMRLALRKIRYELQIK